MGPQPWRSSVRWAAPLPLLAALVAVPAGGMAGAQALQLPPLRDLPRAAREIAAPFSAITSVMDLRSGKVAVSDGVEGQVALVDFAAGTRTQLGRQGSGPGEYRAPATLFRLRADTLWVYDGGQQRLAAYGPDLAPVTPVTFLTFDGQTRTQLIPPMSADEGGRIYAMGVVFASSGSFTMPDTLDLVRIDPRVPESRRTLARVRFQTTGRPTMERLGNTIRYTTQFPGLVASDGWAVFKDGRVAIVRGATYAVEFISGDGARVAGAPIPWDHIPVTQEDRIAELEAAKRQMKDQARMTQRSMPAGLTIDLVVTEPPQWPNEYPAIAPLGMLAAPDGHLWVRRATPARLERQRWDVIDPAGRIVARWQLPVRTELVGLGSGGVAYTARVDEDDLRYIQQVQLPR